MERLGVETHVFHRSCFKCCVCQTQLKPGSYEYDAKSDKFYCRNHYREVLRNQTIKRTMESRGITSFEEGDRYGSLHKKTKFSTTESKKVDYSTGPLQTRDDSKLSNSEEIKTGLPSLLKDLASTKQREEGKTKSSVAVKETPKPKTVLTTVVLQSSGSKQPPSKPAPPKVTESKDSPTTPKSAELPKTTLGWLTKGKATTNKPPDGGVPSKPPPPLTTGTAPSRPHPPTSTVATAKLAFVLPVKPVSAPVKVTPEPVKPVFTPVKVTPEPVKPVSVHTKQSTEPIKSVVVKPEKQVEPVSASQKEPDAATEEMPLKPPRRKKTEKKREAEPDKTAPTVPDKTSPVAVKTEPGSRPSPPVVTRPASVARPPPKPKRVAPPRPNRPPSIKAPSAPRTQKYCEWRSCHLTHACKFV